jgi:hypothetical protein
MNLGVCTCEYYNSKTVNSPDILLVAVDYQTVTGKSKLIIMGFSSG